MFTVGIHAFYNYSDNDIKFTYHKCHFQSSYSCSLHISNWGATQARPSWKAFRFFWKKNKRISQNLIDGTANLCAFRLWSVQRHEIISYRFNQCYLCWIVEAFGENCNRSNSLLSVKPRLLTASGTLMSIISCVH